MDYRIKELIDFTKIKFGLADYHLQTHQLHRSVNIFNETVYTLSMEWFPNHIKVQTDDDLNPDGTAIIEIDIHRKKTESVIFVNNISYANSVNFNEYSRADIINWIERETGFTYKEHFHLDKEKERALYFRASVNGIVTSPSGTIEIKYDEDGKLTLFNVIGDFPSKEMVKEESYSLSLEKVKDLTKEQLKLVEFPSFEEEKLLPVYAIEEVYITNDEATIFPFEVFTDVHGYTKVERIIEWNEPINEKFVGEEIELVEVITVDQAFTNEQSPETLHIGENVQEKCIAAVEHLLRQEYPNGSGDWKLKTLHRDNGYIHAILRLTSEKNTVFRRKFTIIIDADHFEVLNYIDNKMMLDMFTAFDAPAEIVITKEEAYEKLNPSFSLQPVYVYDVEQKQYVLCGKLDCHYGVDVSNGDNFDLDELLIR